MISSDDFEIAENEEEALFSRTRDLCKENIKRYQEAIVLETAVLQMAEDRLSKCKKKI